MDAKERQIERLTAQVEALEQENKMLWDLLRRGTGEEDCWPPLSFAEDAHLDDCLQAGRASEKSAPPTTAPLAASEPMTIAPPVASEPTTIAAPAVPEARKVRSGFNQYAPPDEKIALFRSLFRGREDVYARRWQSLKTGKSGYSPACANEWVPGVCPKPKGSCKDCAHRELLPLTDAVIETHLRGRDAYGRDVIGIYPILPDDTCCFLALDFDDEGWRENVTAVREVCRRWELPCAVERSRSGEGAHLWLFFEAAVSCAEARRLGTALLTAAMTIGGTLKLTAYDRMFPNQDTLPKGGFGNLIALPLQGQARKNGNSIFVNEQFAPYPDQWAFLASTRKLSADEFEAACQLHARGNIFGNLLPSEETPKPWEKKTPVRLTAMDFPAELEIIRSNLLHLPQAGLSPRAKDQLVRLAAFRNPDFYRAQALRLPIYNKPRILNTAEERDGYLALPRGCEEGLTELLDCAYAAYTFAERRNAGREIRVSFTGELRPEQLPAAKALLAHDTGVLAAATAFGKTVVAAWLIGKRKVNTLILVHTQALLNQWRSALEEFLRIDEILEPLPGKRGRKKSRPLIGQLGGGKNTLSGLVDVAIMQSLLSGDEVSELVKDYGHVIVDECHHVSAVTFERIMKEVAAKYVHGLSATPTRADGCQPIVFLQCGPIRYQVDAKEQAKKRGFVQFIIPRFTAFRTAAEEKGVASMYNALEEDEQRNLMIVRDVKRALAQGRSPILLTERREHVERLAALLAPCCPNVITMYGTTSAKLRRETMERLEVVPPTEPLAVIATGKYVGEGFDCPRLDTLFLALPVAWKGTVAQYVGRLHRNYPSKDEVQVYDYVDIHVPMLENMYQKRLKAYAAIGYHIKADAETPLTKDLIYDGKSFYPVLCQDLQSAEKEILIVSPFMSKVRLKKLVKVLTEPILRGVAVKAIVRPPEDLPLRDRKAVPDDAEYLMDYGIQVVFRSGFHQKFTVIDGRISWYGSVNILSFGKSEESVMRLESAEIAGELIDAVTKETETAK